DLFRLHYLLFRSFGFFEIYVDDQLIATIDSYSAESELLTTAEYLLAPGQHTIRIQNTGRSNDLSAGTIIALDAIDVRGTLLAPPGSSAPPTEPRAPAAPVLPLDEGWERAEMGFDTALFQGTWEPIDSPYVSGGSYMFSEDPA